ncbi:MAG: enoyl-CoA hydratase/isomerase family protein [Gemmatimonadota bacterium]
MTSAPVVFETEDRVRTVRLNRPDRLNAVSIDMYRTLEALLADTAADGEVGAVVLTGAGRAFCAGADLKAYGERRPTADERGDYIDTGQRVYRAIQTLPQPVVAAVNGHAIGAGLELALSCDLLVVAADAKLRFPEVALGTFIGGGTSYTLARRVGYARASELILLGRFFTGLEAHDLGLSNRLAESAEAALAIALGLAASLAANAPISLRLAKRVLDRAARADPGTALQLEAEALAECMASEDWEEGVRAFAEGRDPVFRGE